MSKPYIIICDDDTNISADIKNRITTHFDNIFEIVCFKMGFYVLSFLEDNANRRGIIFMDIQLRNENGIDIAKRIKTQYPYSKIIFITGYTEHLSDIFSSKPDNLLFKPFDDEHLFNAVKQAMVSIKEESTKQIIIAPINSGKEIITTSNIMYIESDKRIIIIHTRDGRTIQSYMKCSEIIKSLDNTFIHCHKSYIVNLDCVQTHTLNEFILTDGCTIPISKSRRLTTKEQVINHIKFQDK